jgi:hypothetical protein
MAWVIRTAIGNSEVAGGAEEKREGRKIRRRQREGK